MNLHNRRQRFTTPRHRPSTRLASPNNRHRTQTQTPPSSKLMSSYRPSTTPTTPSTALHATERRPNNTRLHPPHSHSTRKHQHHCMMSPHLELHAYIYYTCTMPPSVRLPLSGLNMIGATLWWFLSLELVGPHYTDWFLGLNCNFSARQLNTWKQINIYVNDQIIHILETRTGVLWPRMIRYWR